MRFVQFMAGTAIIALAVSDPALAQEPPGKSPVPVSTASSRTTTYDAKYFAQYAPRTALDIVRRVPGFTLDLGNTELRGFSGAAGNVVLDGQRPSSKSESLEAVLARIPASRVARVDVGPGDLFGAEYSGKAQVANLILSQGGGIDRQCQRSAARRCGPATIIPNASGSVP